jgi:flotillin
MAESKAKLAEIQAEPPPRRRRRRRRRQEAILVAQREQELARWPRSRSPAGDREAAHRARGRGRGREAPPRGAGRGRRDPRQVRGRGRGRAAGHGSQGRGLSQAHRGLRQQTPQVGPTLLLIEQLPKLVEQQVKAVQNLKIDKITVWDTGHGATRAATPPRTFSRGSSAPSPAPARARGPGGHRTPAGARTPANERRCSHQGRVTATA